MDGFMRVSGGIYPCRGDSLARGSSNSFGILPKLGIPPETRCEYGPCTLITDIHVGEGLRRYTQLPKNCAIPNQQSCSDYFKPKVVAAAPAPFVD